MTTPQSWSMALAAGFCRYAADAGIGTFLESGTYADAAGNLKPGVTAPVWTLNALADKPDQVIVATPYGRSASNRTNDVTLRLQLLIRGTTDQRSITTVSDALLDVFRGALNLTLGGTLVWQVRLMSELPPVRNQANKWEMHQNWYLDCTVPTRHALD